MLQLHYYNENAITSEYDNGLINCSCSTTPPSPSFITTCNYDHLLKAMNILYVTIMIIINDSVCM